MKEEQAGPNPDVLRMRKRLEELSRKLPTRFVGKELFYFEEIDSTNEAAKRLARNALAAEGTLVIAEEQTAGKGRLGRHWLAPKESSLLMSVLLRPSFGYEKVWMVTVFMGLAAAKGIADETGLEVKIKWPNDLMLGERKTGGVLTEIESRINPETLEEEMDCVVVGLGLNVNWEVEDFPSEIVGIATSLSAVVGRKVDRWKLLEKILVEFERLYTLPLEKWPQIVDEWKARSAVIGKNVRVVTSAGEFVGVVVNFDEDGALVLRTSVGEHERILAGDVELVRTEW